MPDDSFSPDLSFLNKKIEPGFRAQGRGNGRREKQSTRAQVANAGNIIHALTAPIHPNVAHGLDTRSHPSGIRKLCRCACHVSPRCLRAWASRLENDPSRLMRTIVGGSRASNEAKTRIVAQDFPETRNRRFSLQRIDACNSLSRRSSGRCRAGDVRRQKQTGEEQHRCEEIGRAREMDPRQW